MLHLHFTNPLSVFAGCEDWHDKGTLFVLPGWSARWQEEWILLQRTTNCLSTTWDRLQVWSKNFPFLIAKDDSCHIFQHGLLSKLWRMGFCFEMFYYCLFSVNRWTRLQTFKISLIIVGRQNFEDKDSKRSRGVLRVISQLSTKSNYLSANWHPNIQPKTNCYCAVVWRNTVAWEF